jgi:AmmeMemoRadiSam system protein B
MYGASMMVTRKSPIAGTWYPSSRRALAEAVERYLAEAERREHAPDLAQGELVALVAPHAGLVYSGAVAAHAYGLLRGRRFDVAILVGPSHFVGFHGVAIVAEGGFETPLGTAVIDHACASELRAASPLVHQHDAAHAREHSVEMQLPFLQHVAPGVPFVPLLMGHQTAGTARALGDALAAVLAGRRGLLVASTDLSHYHDAETAARLDAVVMKCISAFDPDALQAVLDERPEHACGGGPTVAVMRAAKMLGAREAVVLERADSGDVSGDKTSVVGYLAAALGTFAPVEANGIARPTPGTPAHGDRR